MKKLAVLLIVVGTMFVFACATNVDEKPNFDDTNPALDFRDLQSENGEHKDSIRWGE